MPQKSNTTEGYTWKLSSAEKNIIHGHTIPDTWTYTHSTASGFVMFSKQDQDSFRELGIGPVDNYSLAGGSSGKTRIYIAEEKMCGEYDRLECYEGYFTETLRRFRKWLQEY